MGKARYAVFYAPEAEAKLWLFGARWLGRDTITGDDMKRIKLDDVKVTRIAEITAQPRQYGFHATLKPPFRLAKGHDLSMLDEALEAFVAAREKFSIGCLELSELDGFIALRPEKDSKKLQKLAAACVKEFDHFRAPPSSKEMEKRLQADLTDTQKKLLKSWGYPYVMEEYRFHMTLTERLKAKERAVILNALAQPAKAALKSKVKIDAITLFRQKNADEPFEALKCYPFKTLPKPRWPLKKK